MLPIVEVAFGLLVGWLLIESVKKLKRFLPSERMARGRTTIDGLIADAVEKGDVRMLELYEAASREWEQDPRAYHPDFEKAKREAQRNKQAL